MKDTKRVKKIYRIIGICFVGVSLVTGAVIYKMSGKNTVAEALELGNHYLSELDYDAAIREYNYALELDSLNEEALCGLAASYAGMGDLDMAERIYEEKLGDSPNIEVWKNYAKLLEENGNYKKAAQWVSKIMKKQDTEELHQWLDTILAKIMEKQYAYAGSSSVIISMKNDTVYTMGNNILGALGTAEEIGTNHITTTMKKIEFSGTAESVFTTGKNSFIVDNNQELWIAGSNRSSQQTNNKVELIPKSGWTKEMELTGVVKVVGTDATVFVLTKDGKLWMRGANPGYVAGNAWKGLWTQVKEHETITDVYCEGNKVIFLTINGEVYECDVNNNYYSQNYISSSYWNRKAAGIVELSMNQNGEVIYLTNTGTIVGYYGDALPKDWERYNIYGYVEEFQPTFIVSDIVLNGQGIYLLENTGALYYSHMGKCEKIEIADTLVHIYFSNGNCVGQKQNGEYILLDSSGKVVEDK